MYACQHFPDMILEQLGVMLNSLKRLLDTLRPRIEGQMKTWVACLPEDGGPGRIVFGEHLNEVTIELRAKYKNYLQSIVEKLSDNVSSFVFIIDMFDVSNESLSNWHDMCLHVSLLNSR